MTAVDTSLSSLLSPKLAATASTPTVNLPVDDAKSTSSSGFGAAVTLLLSPAAQQVVNTSASTDTPTKTDTAASNGSAPAGGSGPKGGGGAPAASTSSTDDATLITEAKRKAATEVGVAQAANVVNADGTISQVAVNKVLAEQAAEKLALSA